MSGPVIDWNEAHLAILKAGVAAGDSYTQIAKRIPLCTRCAAIGKAKRLGLSKSAAPSAPSGVKARSAPQHRTTLRIAGRGTVFEQSEAHPPRVAVPSRSEPPGKRTILTVGTYECRWPIGDPSEPDFTLCGCRAEDGPYCEPHKARAHTSEATRAWVDRKLDIPKLARSA
jgi:GcrA cell cycle regulator